MTTCSGLPICLSGIQIFPQNQKNLRRRVRSDLDIRINTSVAPVHVEGESMASDCEANTSGVSSDHGDVHEERSPELSANTFNWPRLSLAQQMADLDFHREAVRRRSLQARTHLVDYRVTSQRNNLIAACLKDKLRIEEDSPDAPKSICAKAA
ncbi:hypothetical protein KP509_28G011500 [Ceratopteris richardii]|uniref:Uncharacterized protein n=1 Tax=Ceratopteris richardii TaxID=49495 RepID=A0A8T2RC49_CERRI|nr:hypothetical protein KP509_28G011500 [Ceratopteris richardii]